MDSKRKADRGASSDGGDRKRRKTADFDLTNGETPETTTVYGLSFLEQIRRTADKSGRLVATYFEKLVPRQGNAEYYRRTKLPISLENIEKKLNNGEFKTLAELESYLKRMIANAKEFYPRSSSTFDDAERIRKAVSNYMTRTNPAYHNIRGYQALPTPLPPDDDEDADGEEAEEDDGEEQEEEQEEDAEGEDEDAEGEEEEEEEEDGEEEDEEPTSRRKSIILKRRVSSRPSRNSISYSETPRRSSINPLKPDHQYEDVPYKGLTFQQAQEKLVEELIRHTEPDYDDAYFEPFVNLPPRSLKDYYRIITDPLSLKKLQKSIKGVHGRNDATGVSDFKSWSTFGEKSKLLWNNAYFYNEEGSEIYSLAQDLEKQFQVQFKQAKAAAPEPSQPKIKLKVGSGTETPVSGKKITIHVGGRGDSVDSPAPLTGKDSPAPPTNGITRASAGPLEAVRAGSAAVGSPSPSAHAGLKVEGSAQLSPAVAAGTPGAVAGIAKTPIPAVVSQPIPTTYIEKKRLRIAGKGVDDALIARLRLQAHPTMQAENPNLLTVFPEPKEMQSSATVHLPAHQTRIFIVPRLPDFLHNRQYSLWALLNKQPLKPFNQLIPDQVPQDRAFEVILAPGLNVIETHLIAATPRAERENGGPEVELEVFTVFVNVLRS